MDDNDFEPMKFKMPRLGKVIAAFFIGVAKEVKELFTNSKIRLTLLSLVLRVWTLLRQFYVLILVLIAVALFGGLWFDLIADLRLLVSTAAKGAVAELSGNEDSGTIRQFAWIIAAGATALVAAATAPFALIKAWVNERQATTAEQGLITDRITKAVEQLGSEKTVKVISERRKGAGKRFETRQEVLERTEPNLEVRLGALYALERIAEDSERDHIPIMETLCAYIRENSKARPPEDYPEPEWVGLEDYSDEAAREAHLEKRRERFGNYPVDSKAWKWAQALPGPRADIQAALRIIGRRSELRLAYEKRKKYQLDLRAANLQRCDLSTLRLGPALLTRARLEGANLIGAKMEGANLIGAKMEGANLSGAKMEGADLRGAEMKGANLSGAKMEGAYLSGAKMEGANLRGAEMKGANLSGAKMEGAYLGGAKMEGANLRGAEMKGANLFMAKMEGAYLRGAKMEGANLSGAILK